MQGQRAVHDHVHLRFMRPTQNPLNTIICFADVSGKVIYFLRMPELILWLIMLCGEVVTVMPQSCLLDTLFANFQDRPRMQKIAHRF